MAGYYPNKTPFLCAAKYEGVFPSVVWGTEFGPSELSKVLDIIKETRRTLKDFDVAVTGTTTWTDQVKDGEIVQSWKAAGANWWLEMITDWVGSKSNLIKRIGQGPPD